MDNQKVYTVDRAAYLLGVDEAALRKLIDRDMVDLVDAGSDPKVPHHEIARLYGKVEEILANLPMKKEDTAILEQIPERVEAVPEWPREEIRVHDPELLKIHEKIQGFQNRLKNLGSKMKRLGVRAQRLHAMAHGEQARFMERAAAIFPQLWSDTRFKVEKEDDDLVIRRLVTTEEDEYRNRLGGLIREGIEKGMLPQGFLGMVFQRPDDDDAQDTENE